jgi:hypothetical protein
MMKPIRAYLQTQAHLGPLAVFRILFGGVMFFSAARFLLLGWVDEQYVKPTVHFTYYGFEWVKPLGEAGMYLLFGLMLASSLGILLGLFYRISSLVFFFVFTYIELIDKTYYLNHYYFASICAFLMTLAPAHRCFSLDILRNPALASETAPRWTIDIFKLQLGIVYTFAGIAKINSEWLFNAMPLRIWLPPHYDMPLIGWAFQYPATAYLFSWGGMMYDCTIVFFLIWNRTRWMAYLAVIAFHSITGLLFQIGVFPLVMIALTLIFFPESFHQKIIAQLSRLIRSAFNMQIAAPKSAAYFPSFKTIILIVITVHFILQIVIPFRYALYPDNLFWSEEGYRFSWRVMLVEKAGTARFFVKDSRTGREGEVINSEFLNAHQEKQMSFQPDMILQFAHFLRDHYEKLGMENPEVRAEVFVTMNGRRSKPLVDSSVNLANEREGFHHKTWIVPFERHFPLSAESSP